MSRIYQGGQAKKSYKGSARGANFNPTQVTNQTNAIRRQGKQELDNLKSQDRERRRSEEAASTSRQFQNQLDKTQQRIVQQELTDQQNLQFAVDRNILAASQTYKKGELALNQLVERTDQGIKFSADKSKLEYNQLLEKNYLQLQDLQERTQLGIEARAVQAEGAISQAELSAQQKVDNANRQVTQAFIQGLVDFATTGISVVSQENERKRKEAEQTEFFHSLITPFNPDDAVEIETAKVIRIETQAFEDGVQTVAPNSAVERENIRGVVADSALARKLGQRDGATAALTFGSDFSAIMRDPNTVVTFNGVPTRLGDLDPTQLTTAALQIAKQITASYGLGKDNLSLAAKVAYGAAVRQAVNNEVLSLTSDIISRDKSRREFGGIQEAAALMATGRAQDAYEELFDSLKTSGNYEDKSKVELSKIALEKLIEVTPPAKLNLLFDIVKDDNSNTKFGDPGNFPYGDLISDAIDKADSEAWTRDQRQSARNTMDARNTYREFQLELARINNPDDAEKLRMQTIAQLESMGPEAVDFISNVRNGGNMRQTPAKFLQMVDEINRQEGQTRQERLDALSRGAITKPQYDQLEALAATLDDISEIKTKAGLGNSKEEIQSIVATAATSGNSKLSLQEAKVATSDIASIITQRYDRELENFIRLQGDNPDPVKIRIEAKRLKDEIRSELIGDPNNPSSSGNLRVDGYSITYDNFSEPLAPPVVINPTTGRAQANLANNNPSVISANKYSMDDILYTRAAYLDEVEVLQSGSRNYSQRTKDLAKTFNVSPQQLLRRQADALGYPKDALNEISYNLINAVEQPESLKQGMAALENMGFPERGAAYLAGNIMQESSFNGQRTWDDGGSPAGGLMSWRGDRLDRFESQFLNKPVTEATNAEQMMAMIKEMKRDYPASYRVFMNPNATDVQLRRASEDYLVWGEEGDRFKFAESLINGTYSYPSSGSLQSYRGQVGSITFERDFPRGQPGMDVYFEDKRFPAVLSGRVKEVNYQVENDGSGYGHYIVVESIDPLSGATVDVLYGHFAQAPRYSPGQSITAGQVLGTQGGTGSVQSVDGTIASIDFLAPAAAGSKSKTPYSNYKRLREEIRRQLTGQ